MTCQRCGRVFPLRKGRFCGTCPPTPKRKRAREWRFLLRFGWRVFSLTAAILLVCYAAAKLVAIGQHLATVSAR